MPATVYPFPRLFGDVLADVVGARIDGSDLPDAYLDREARSINVYSIERAKWLEVDIDLTLEAPIQEIRAKDIDEARLFALVRLNCDATNLRATELVSLRAGAGSSTLTFRRDMVAEKATIAVVLVLDGDDGIPRILREAQPWQLLFTAPKTHHAPSGRRRGRIRDFVEIQWLDFIKSSISTLSEHPREAYFVDVSADPPILWLNSSLNGYEALLSDRAGASRTEEALRDLEYRRLAMGVWLALAQESIAGLSFDSELDEPSIPEGWRADVLDRILPRLYPGVSLELAKRRVLALKDQDGNLGFLYGLLQIAVNEIIDSSAVLRKHLNSLTESGV